MSTTTSEIKQVDPTAVASERGLLVMVLLVVLLGTAAIFLTAG